MGKPTGASAPDNKKPAAAAPAGQAPAGGGEQHHHAPKPSGGAKGKRPEPAPGACFAVGCKASAKRFNFCDEHYDHFKFGLITKSGDLVSDYEKKIEHYLAHQRKTGTARKVA